MTGIHIDFTGKQLQAIEKYIHEHYCKNFTNNSGGFGSTSKLSFIVGSTSIGPTLTIYCPYCEETIDITNIDAW